MAKRKGLGRGLEHLLSQNVNDFDDVDYDEAQIAKLPLDEIRPNPFQPRKYFDEAALNELAASIEAQGVFQPILVRKTVVGYEIISGERRFRASQIAGMEDIPALIEDYDDEKMMEVALVENIQREDLTIVEEARSYKLIMDNLSLTQDALSKKVGKSRSHVANILRILKLDDSILDLLDSKQVSMGHVKVLITLDDAKLISSIVEKIIAQGLSVRQVEELAKEVKEPKKAKEVAKKVVVVPRNKRLESSIREKMDTKVKINGNDKGSIEFYFSSEEDLGRILEKLKLI